MMYECECSRLSNFTKRIFCIRPTYENKKQQINRMTPAQTHTHWMIGGFCFVTYNICNWNKQMSVCVTSKGHGKTRTITNDVCIFECACVLFGFEHEYIISRRLVKKPICRLHELQCNAKKRMDVPKGNYNSLLLLLLMRFALVENEICVVYFCSRPTTKLQVLDNCC